MGRPSRFRIELTTIFPMQSSHQLPIIGVMGSGTRACPELAEPLGTWLAREGVHLLTGGGGGNMACVCKAFCSVSERKGRSIGILPGETDRGGFRIRSGYPNDWVEIPVFTHLPLSGSAGTEPMSRNHINILTSDVIIALPGSAGTASELSLAWKYGKPAAALLKKSRDLTGTPLSIPVYYDVQSTGDFIRTSLAQSGRLG